MAKIKKNSFLQGLNGSVGEMVFRQMPDGSTRVSAKPNNKRKFNQEQKGYQDRLCLFFMVCLLMFNSKSLKGGF
jgi:hypothetical protein